MGGIAGAILFLAFFSGDDRNDVGLIQGQLPAHGGWLGEKKLYFMWSSFDDR